MADERDVLRIEKTDLPGEDAVAAQPSSRSGEPGARVERLAVVALVLGVLSVLFAGVAIGPIAVVCGLVAGLRCHRSESRGLGLAALSIFLGVAGVGLWSCIIWYLVVTRQGASKRTDATMPPITTGTLEWDAIDRAAPAIQRAIRSSVSLTMERPGVAGWERIASGSGTVVSRLDDTLFILTCRHVVEESETRPSSSRLTVTWAMGEAQNAIIEWMAEAPFDLAVVSAVAPAGGAFPEVAVLGDPGSLGIGDPVFAIGDPLDFRTSYVAGVVSAVRTVKEGAGSVRVFQTQVPLNPGNSGGGLYKPDGGLIGVNTWTMRKDVVEGMGFSISVENLWTALKTAPPRVSAAFEQARQRTTEGNR